MKKLFLLSVLLPFLAFAELNDRSYNGYFGGGGGGSLSFPLQGTGGSAAAPDYSWAGGAGASDSGLYKIGNKTWGLAANGTLIVEIDGIVSTLGTAQAHQIPGHLTLPQYGLSETGGDAACDPPLTFQDGTKTGFASHPIAGFPSQLFTCVNGRQAGTSYYTSGSGTYNTIFAVDIVRPDIGASPHGTVDLGSTSNNWTHAYIAQVKFGDGTAAGERQFINITGETEGMTWDTTNGQVLGVTLYDTNVSTTHRLDFRAGTSKWTQAFTADSTVNATAAYSYFITGQPKSAGTGNGGDVYLKGATSSGGTAGAAGVQSADGTFALFSKNDGNHATGAFVTDVSTTGIFNATGDVKTGAKFRNYNDGAGLKLCTESSCGYGFGSDSAITQAEFYFQMYDGTQAFKAFDMTSAAAGTSVSTAAKSGNGYNLAFVGGASSGANGNGGQLQLGGGAKNGSGAAGSAEFTTHAKTTGTAPTATPNANLGGSATCTVFHATDMAGQVTLTAGTVPSLGALCAVNFNVAYQVAPVCVMWPGNSVAAANIAVIQQYVTSSTSAMTINGAAAPTATLVYIYNYHCIEPNS